jgi:hypothetical protein
VRSQADRDRYRRWKAANLERVRVLHRASYWRNVEARRAQMREAARAAPPERWRAHHAVMHAVRAGELVREPCVVCGAARVHAHHFDYRAPLWVLWLCPQHHKAWHLLEARIGVC